MRNRCLGYARLLGVATLTLIIAVSLWTPMLHPRFAERWFGWPGILLTSPVPMLLALLTWRGWRGLQRNEHLSPFICALGWFVLCFAGLGISMFPLMVPPSIDIWQAAAPHDSQLFLLVGALVMVSIIIILYTGYIYWMFRGKVTVGAHYHMMYHRVLWFVALWAGGVLTVGAVATVLRLAMRAAVLD